MKKSILLVSHSQQLTEGLKQMIEEMADGESVTIYSLGGTAEGELGSDATKIVDAVNESADAELILVFADLGSAVLNAELAYDMLEPQQQERYHLIDAPWWKVPLLQQSPLVLVMIWRKSLQKQKKQPRKDGMKHEKNH